MGGISQCSLTSPESETLHTQQSSMLILCLHRKKWKTSTKKILRLKKEKRKSKVSSRSTKLTKSSSVKYQSCSGQSFANSKSSMRCKESKMEKIAHLIKVATSSSMGQKKLSSLRKGWLTIKSTFSTRNLHPDSHGLLKSDHKQRHQIDHLNCLLCKSNLVREEPCRHILLDLRITSASTAQFHLFESPSH